ncbi:MAG: chromosome partitioning protein ParB, partial [Solirubrobacterales bacterium]|nr:chromosome partitioning protein ParB [Solirubrobacterales bacterium]
EAMPPIDVFRVGDAHFVRDGHHRVSVARIQGERTIDAWVTEVVTKVGADGTLRIADLPQKGHERLFAERVPLGPQARGRLRLSDPWRYGELAEGVDAWGFRLLQRDGVSLGRAEVARRWFSEEYAPVVALLREAALFDAAREREADAYLRLSAERYRIMRSQEWSDEAVEGLRRG